MLVLEPIALLAGPALIGLLVLLRVVAFDAQLARGRFVVGGVEVELRALLLLALLLVAAGGALVVRVALALVGPDVSSSSGGP
jgi:hypothetical protein